MQHKTWAPLGRGGRYQFGEQQQYEAVGATLYCDSLYQLLDKKITPRPKRYHDITRNTSFEERDNFIKQGFTLRYK